MGEINLTSLLDVAFVLLLAFIMVAPRLKHGVEVDLPKVPGEGIQQLPSEPARPPVVVTVAASGRYFVDGSPIDNDIGLEQELGRRLAARKELPEAKGTLAVELRASGGVAYEAVVGALAAARRAGIEAVTMPVDVTADGPGGPTGGGAGVPPEGASRPRIPAWKATRPPKG